MSIFMFIYFYFYIFFLYLPSGSSSPVVPVRRTCRGVQPYLAWGAAQAGQDGKQNWEMRSDKWQQTTHTKHPTWRPQAELREPGHTSHETNLSLSVARAWPLFFLFCWKDLAEPGPLAYRGYRKVGRRDISCDMRIQNSNYNLNSVTLVITPDLQPVSIDLLFWVSVEVKRVLKKWEPRFFLRHFFFVCVFAIWNIKPKAK